MGNNSTTEIGTLEKASLDALAQQAVNSFFRTVLGFIGILANLFIVLPIVKTKALHNKSHFAICSHAFSEMIYALCTSLIGIRQYGLYLLGWPGLLSQVSCTTWQLSIEPIVWHGNVVFIGLGIDRFLAVAAPIVYRSISVRKHALLLNAIGCTLALLCIASGYATMPRVELVAVCAHDTAFGMWHLEVWGQLSQALLGVTCFVYVCSLVVTGYRYWGTRWLNAVQKTEWAREVQLNAFKSIFIIFVAHVLFFGVNPFLTVLLLNGTIPASYTGSVILFLTIEFLVENISHFVIYFIVNTKFRTSFLEIIRYHSPNSVVPLHG